MSEKPIRVLIVDDHAIVRRGIRALLITKDDIEVVGGASGGREAVELAESLHPDVIVMDLVMKDMDGIEATRLITQHHPEIRILVLTSFSTDEKVFPAIKAGAMGYLLKDTDPEELVEAIRRVYSGDASLHPAIARKVLQELAHPSSSTEDSQVLSERELEVTRLIAKGLMNKEIAARLSISETTVRTHVSHILRKLHLASRNEVTLYALREGLTSLDD